MEVFVADEQGDQPVDVARWESLARDVLTAEGVSGDAELALAAPEVRAGDDIGLGGNGFRPLSTVVLTWADGRGDPMTVTTDAQGNFLALFPTRQTDRAGERTLVATGGDQVARVDVQIARNKRLDERTDRG